MEGKKHTGQLKQSKSVALKCLIRKSRQSKKEKQQRCCWNAMHLW